MRHEVRSIPPAPRRVRLRPLLAFRWPMLALGGALTVAGSLLAWLMFLQEGGKPSIDRHLDAGPNAIVTATVKSVDPAFDRGGRRWQWVHYSFELPKDPVWDKGATADGASFVDADRFAAGDRVEVEYSVANHNENRILGGHVWLDRAWLHPPFWLATLVTPGALVLIGWLASVFQLRHVLVHGDVTVGTVLDVANVRLMLPEMLRVTYEFRDHHASVRRHSHWVRTHGALGARLTRQMHTGWFEAMPVLHDRRLPQWNRMLLPQDFLRTTSKDAEPANGVL
jgi:hypothetical protein